MAKKISASARLKQLAAQIPEDRITRVLMQALESHPSPMGDRSIAIIGSALVEKALEVSILARLGPFVTPEVRKGIFDHNSNGPLADFSARIKMAHAMDIVGKKTTADLNRIRTIRNAFAHTVQLLDFDGPEVAELCRDLEIFETLTLLGGWEENTAPRTMYVRVTLGLADRLKSDLIHPKRQGLGALFTQDHLYRSRLLP